LPSSPAPYDVLAFAVRAAVSPLHSAQLSTSGLFDGLSFDEERLSLLRRVPWDEYAVLCERIEERAGGPEALQDLIENSYADGLPEIGMLAGALIHPKRFFTVTYGFLAPLVWPALECSVEDLPADQLRLVLRLRPGARPCIAWFRSVTGYARRVMRHFDIFPPARFLVAEVAADHGFYDLRLPPPSGRARRVGRVSRAVVEHVVARVIFGEQAGPMPGDDAAPSSGGSRLERTTVAWGLTRRQTQVLRLVVHGRANKEIACELACAESTVELHVTQLLRKAGVRSRAEIIARFWSGGA
jgi:DNA-binding CsgD family transcriptional regulator